MEKRIKQVRRKLQMTQEAFGKGIGVRRNTITAYETGNKNPSDLAIAAMCREFGINEEWLRYGRGAMFSDDEVTRSIEAKRLAELYDNGDGMTVALFKTFLMLSEQNRDIILGALRLFVEQANEASKPDIAPAGGTTDAAAIVSRALSRPVPYTKKRPSARNGRKAVLGDAAVLGAAALRGTYSL